jgi:WD40 repeat protein
VWNVTDPARPHLLTDLASGTTPPAGYVAFSPTDRVLAAGEATGGVQLWDIANPARARMMGTTFSTSSGLIGSLTFSRDGRTLAVDSDNAVSLWDVADPARPRALGRPLITGDEQDPDGAASMALSPDGRLLAAGFGNGVLTVWNISDPASPWEAYDFYAADDSPRARSRSAPAGCCWRPGAALELGEYVAEMSADSVV